MKWSWFLTIYLQHYFSDFIKVFTCDITHHHHHKNLVLLKDNKTIDHYCTDVIIKTFSILVVWYKKEKQNCCCFLFFCIFSLCVDTPLLSVWPKAIYNALWTPEFMLDVNMLTTCAFHCPNLHACILEILTCIGLNLLWGLLLFWSPCLTLVFCILARMC